MNQKGFSLIEIIISIAFLSIVLAAFLGLVSKANEKDENSFQRAEALSISKNLIEALRASDSLESYAMDVDQAERLGNSVSVKGSELVNEKAYLWAITILPTSNKEAYEVTIDVSCDNVPLMNIRTYHTWIGGPNE